MKNSLIAILSILIVFLAAGGFFYLITKENPSDLSQGNYFTSSEVSFLKSSGFLDPDTAATAGKIDNAGKETAKISRSDLKSPDLVEQKLDSSEERFEILATKLDFSSSGYTYQMAFNLENKSDQPKEFYLIPVSEKSQLQFQEIKGVIDNKDALFIRKDNVLKEQLASLYNVEQHKKELKSELVKAYDDIAGNNYEASPVKIILDANSTLLAKSQWEIKGETGKKGAPSSILPLSGGGGDKKENPPPRRGGGGVGDNPLAQGGGDGGGERGLKPVYFLVYGSAGGGKDELDKEKKEYKNKWLGSYETLAFSTSDGDLDVGQYALDESGKGYYIRTKPKSEAQFEYVDLTYDVSKLKQVNVVMGAHCYYDEFLTAAGAKAIWGEKKKEMPSGGVLRVPSTAKKYWDTARIKNYPQPERVEMVEELPPPEPEPTPPEHHSIVLDAASDSGVLVNAISYSYSHTCTGDNRLLVVGNSNDNYQTVTGVTFNADALTSIRSDNTGLGAISTLHFMVAPDTGGSHTVVVTFSDIVGYGGGGAISYIGAAQTGQPDNHNGANSDAGNPTVNVTTIADNSWVVSVLQGVYPVTCGNTERWNILRPNGYWPAGGSDTNGPVTPAGVQTMSWTAEDSSNWAISAASFAPAVEAPPATTESVKIKSGFKLKGGLKFKF